MFASLRRVPASLLLVLSLSAPPYPSPPRFLSVRAFFYSDMGGVGGGVVYHSRSGTTTYGPLYWVRQMLQVLGRAPLINPAIVCVPVNLVTPRFSSWGCTTAAFVFGDRICLPVIPSVHCPLPAAPVTAAAPSLINLSPSTTVFLCPPLAGRLSWWFLPPYFSLLWYVSANTPSPRFWWVSHSLPHSYFLILLPSRSYISPPPGLSLPEFFSFLLPLFSLFSFNNSTQILFFLSVPISLHVESLGFQYSCLQLLSDLVFLQLAFHSIPFRADHVICSYSPSALPPLHSNLIIFPDLTQL